MEVRECLLDIDKELLGTVVFNKFCSETSGSLEEIGEDLSNVILNCKTQEEYDLVNKTIVALCGINLEKIIEIAQTPLNEERDL